MLPRSFQTSQVRRTLRRLIPVMAVCIGLQGYGQDSSDNRLNPDANQGTGQTRPTLTLTHPVSGWSVSRMVRIAGHCSDDTANPIRININGSRYYARAVAGSFDREFPAARGWNQVTVSCANRGGSAEASRAVHAAIPANRLKVVLSSDTDGVYTDLHVYEPDATHVYWAATRSPSGGLFFLNAQNGGVDQPGYGPYLYVHPSPLPGIYKLDANYWPGGARQHTAAKLEVIVDEGLPQQQHRQVSYPLARPGENQTMAYVIISEPPQPPVIYVPLEDPPEMMPVQLRTQTKNSSQQTP